MWSSVATVRPKPADPQQILDAINRELGVVEGAPPLPRRPANLAPWGASDSLVVVGEAALRPPG